MCNIQNFIYDCTKFVKSRIFWVEMILDVLHCFFPKNLVAFYMFDLNKSNERRRLDLFKTMATSRFCYQQSFGFCVFCEVHNKFSQENLEITMTDSESVPSDIEEAATNVECFVLNL